MQKDKNALSEDEKKEAKNNAFILIGKTGSGKSTLLNAINGKEVCLAKRSAEAVTKESTLHYYRLENGKPICFIDTPGLFDPKNLKEDYNDIDKKHLEGIIKCLKKEEVHVKGLLFLVNFQEERFDRSEVEAMVSYNALFPLEDFWKRIIIIFTHHYADPDGDNEEDMRKERDASNGKVIKDIMDRVKKISTPVTYKEICLKYFNSYSPAKNERQKNKNIKVRDELEAEIDKKINLPPFFTRVVFVDAKNIPYDKGDGKEYIADIKYICYYDFTEREIGRHNLDIKNVREKVHINYGGWGGGGGGGGGGSGDSPPNINKKDMNVQKDDNGNLTPNVVDYGKKGGLVGGFLGAGISGLITFGACSNPAGLAILGAAAIGGVIGGASGFALGKKYGNSGVAKWILDAIT